MRLKITYFAIKLRIFFYNLGLKIYSIIISMSTVTQISPSPINTKYEPKSLLNTGRDRYCMENNTIPTPRTKAKKPSLRQTVQLLLQMQTLK